MLPPTIDIDLAAFKLDPYPALADMRKHSPICYVPQLRATLLTRRDDIFKCEKIVEVFSSDQPGGLMTRLMGRNMMRKDGEEHLIERRQIQAAVSPRTIIDTWKRQFEIDTQRVLDELEINPNCDLVKDFAMPVSAHALRHITGLTNMSPNQLDASSQGMIDGIANYAGDEATELRCTQATALIDRCIDEMLASKTGPAAKSMLAVLTNTDQPMESIRANIKLAISGGQNEPRDAIALATGFCRILPLDFTHRHVTAPYSERIYYPRHRLPTREPCLINVW